jgi:hypothetical protein
VLGVERGHGLGIRRPEEFVAARVPREGDEVVELVGPYVVRFATAIELFGGEFSDRFEHPVAGGDLWTVGAHEGGADETRDRSDDGFGCIGVAVDDGGGTAEREAGGKH